MRTLTTFALILAAAHGATAQSLSRRIAGSDGIVDVVYPSRPGACGDGHSYIQGIIGSGSTYQDDSRGVRGACVRGPAHVAVTVMNGEITRLRTFVGPRDPALAGRTIRATAAEAADWLEHIINESERSSLASQAVLPLMLVDSVRPWQSLLNVARSDDRPAEVRKNVMMWLASAIDAGLGLGRDDESDDAQVRAQAVYTISQRNRSESVPTLMELARSSPHPEVRKAAIYWLGQTGDPRAVGVYAELLGLR